MKGSKKKSSCKFATKGILKKQKQLTILLYPTKTPFVLFTFIVNANLQKTLLTLSN